MTSEIIVTIIAAVSSGALSTFLTLVITSRQTIRKAAAAALSEEAGAVKNAIAVWQQTVEFLSGRVAILEEEIVNMRKERSDVIVHNDAMLKSISAKDEEITNLRKEIEKLIEEITTLNDRIIVLEKRLLA